MGTYTMNKNLFMPTVGETGWGTLVNGNFETIDNFLKPITVSGSTYTFTGNHVGNQSGGTISATSITNSGTLTNTGKITANGGIETKALTATSISNSGTLTQTGTSTFAGKITANGGIGTKALTATTGTFSGAVTGASFNNVDINAYTFTISTTDGPSYSSLSIDRINETGTSTATRSIGTHTLSSDGSNFGTVSGTIRFVYEDNYRLYQFDTVNLPTSGITYKVTTRSNATLTIDGITCTTTGTTITRAQVIRLLTQHVNYSITTSGSGTSGLFDISFTNTTSNKHYMYIS